MQFAIPLSRGKEPIRRQVYTGLRRAVLGGAFGSQGRLPSTRDLAEQLGVSRSVVVEAYEQLLAEGFVTGRGGSGTYVAQGVNSKSATRGSKSAKIRLSAFGVASEKAAISSAVPQPSTAHRYDFKFGRSESDVETFPFAQWQRTLARRARMTSLAELDYGPTAGNPSLRQAIAEHLQRSRRVACSPSQVIVVNGSQQALDLIARVLLERGDRVAIEDPSYQGAREILTAAGARLVPVPVDYEGLNPALLPRDARLCFVTPSHQFPTGAVLTLARRLALLAWTKATNAVIVEDDYDGEFRYEGQPVESLQGLDTEGRVIYVGTFSRTIYPALRVGYLVVPKALVQAFTGAKWLNDQHSAVLEQRALAEFILSGAYERHLRRVRRRNASRRKALLDALASFLVGKVELTGAAAGAHVCLWLPPGVDESAFVARAAQRGVGVYGISRYFMAAPRQPAVMLGYARLREAEIKAGIRILGEILRNKAERKGIPRRAG